MIVILGVLIIIYNNYYEIFTKFFAHKNNLNAKQDGQFEFQKASTPQENNTGKTYQLYGTLMAPLAMRLLRKYIYL